MIADVERTRERDEKCKREEREIERIVESRGLLDAGMGRQRDDSEAECDQDFVISMD